MRQSDGTGTSPTRQEPGARRRVRLLLRALRLRCPHCGGSPMFASWLKLKRACAACGLVYERGEHDYFIGAYLLNLIIAELIVVAVLLMILLATWPEVPWRAVPWIIVALTVPGVVLTYPFSRAFWLAIDLLFRPPEQNDFERADTPVTP